MFHCPLPMQCSWPVTQSLRSGQRWSVSLLSSVGRDECLPANLKGLWWRVTSWMQQSTRSGAARGCWMSLRKCEWSLAVLAEQNSLWTPKFNIRGRRSVLLCMASVTIIKLICLTFSALYGSTITYVSNFVSLKIVNVTSAYQAGHSISS